MRDIVLQNLEKRFASYVDLIDEVSDELLTRTLPVPKHKTLADHLWCVIGSRESYARAIVKGEWLGFDCSLKKYDLESFKESLTLSSETFKIAASQIGDWNTKRLFLLAELSEHEVMHQGQIIRHMLALEQTLPRSWRWA